MAGLALDAYLHAHDATLAEHERVSPLTNPGHLLFAVGLALTALGASALLLAPAFGAHGRRGVLLPVLAAGAVLALSGGAFAVAAENGALDNHDHAEEA